MKALRYILPILFLALVSTTELFAQCAMCKASAETSVEGGEKAMAGINMGVLYLLSMPFIVIGFIAFHFFRLERQRRAAGEND